LLENLAELATEVLALLPGVTEAGSPKPTPISAPVSAKAAAVVKRQLETVETVRTVLEQGDVLVGVVGLVNGGKSTFISSLLGAHVAPPSSYPLTMVPVRYNHSDAVTATAATTAAAAAVAPGGHHGHHGHHGRRHRRETHHAVHHTNKRGVILKLPVWGQLNEAAKIVREEIVRLERRGEPGENKFFVGSLKNQQISQFAERLLAGVEFRAEYEGEMVVHQILAELQLLFRLAGEVALSLKQLEQQQKQAAAKGITSALPPSSFDAAALFSWASNPSLLPQVIFPFKGLCIAPSLLPSPPASGTPRKSGVRVSVIDMPGLDEEQIEAVMKEGVELLHVLVVVADVRENESTSATRLKRFIIDTAPSRNPKFFVGSKRDELQLCPDFADVQQHFQDYAASRTMGMKDEEISQLKSRVKFVSGRWMIVCERMVRFIDDQGRKPYGKRRWGQEQERRMIERQQQEYLLRQQHSGKQSPQPAAKATEVTEKVAEDGKEDEQRRGAWEAEIVSSWIEIAKKNNDDEEELNDAARREVSREAWYENLSVPEIMKMSERLRRQSHVGVVEEDIWKTIERHSGDLMCNKAAEKGARICREVMSQLAQVMDTEFAERRDSRSKGDEEFGRELGRLLLGCEREQTEILAELARNEETLIADPEVDRKIGEVVQRILDGGGAEERKKAAARICSESFGVVRDEIMVKLSAQAAVVCGKYEERVLRGIVGEVARRAEEARKTFPPSQGLALSTPPTKGTAEEQGGEERGGQELRLECPASLGEKLVGEITTALSSNAGDGEVLKAITQLVKRRIKVVLRESRLRMWGEWQQKCHQALAGSAAREVAQAVDARLAKLRPLEETWGRLSKVEAGLQAQAIFTRFL